MDIPIRLQDGLIWVRVQIGARSANFVVDTGAAVTVFSLKTARDCGLKLDSPLDVAGVEVNTCGYRLAKFDATLSGIPLTSRAIALDLDNASQNCSQPIAGLIGADFFKGKIVQLDSPNKLMHISSGGLPRSANSNTLPLRYINGVFCVPISVTGSERCWTRLDTGCTDALHWAPQGNKTSTIIPSIALASAATSSRLLTVQIGRQTFPNVPATLHKKAIFPGETGLLGNALLARMCVTIDATRNCVTFENAPR